MHPSARGAGRADFKLLAKIAERNGLRLLSMGMSGDYEEAIAHGATHVRVGTAIFGARHSPEAAVLWPASRESRRAKA